MDLTALTRPETYVSLLTLTAMEIVLGIDNVVFLSILVARLPADRQAVARRLGLGLALATRLGLLFAVSWVMGLTEPWFSLFGRAWSGRDLILLGGGLFLVAKSTHEIYGNLESAPKTPVARVGAARFGFILGQIVLLDIVFSLDSVITAVGMARHVAIMVVAMVAAVVVMLAFARSLAAFVERHPSMKVLALSFLLLIGVMLVAEGMGQHLSRAYVYFAMGFSLLVELLNMRVRKRAAPLVLHHRFEGEGATGARGPLPGTT